MLAGFRYMDRSHQERVITALFIARGHVRVTGDGWLKACAWGGQRQRAEVLLA